MLGLLVGISLKGDALAIAGTGAIGSYTTFSTWILESQRFGEDGADRMMALNLLGSLATGIVAVWLGRKLGGLVCTRIA